MTPVYIIIGLGVLAFISMAVLAIRRGGEDKERANTAEAKVTEITQVVKDANTIEANNAALTDAELDDKLHARSNN